MGSSDDLFKQYKRECLRHNRERMNLDYLRSCKKNRIIPKFLSVKNKMMKCSFPRQTFDYEFSCLCILIRIKFALLARIAEKISESGDKLRSTINPAHWEDYQMKLSFYLRVQSAAKEEVHMKKFKLLMNDSSHRKDPVPIDFINLSSKVFSQDECTVLNKGPKFVLEKPPSIENVIPQLEDALRYVDPDSRFLVRNRMFFELQKYIGKQKRSNSNAHDFNVLKNIRKDTSVIALRTDKTNRFAFLDSADYVLKMNETIKDLQVIAVKSDPLKKLTDKVKALIKEGKWPEDMARNLGIHKVPMIPTLFARLKDHKPGLPLRPIVDRSIGPLYMLEKAFVILLKKILPDSQYVVQSTNSFIDCLKGAQLPRNFIMASLDVVSLFPSVDIYKVQMYIVDLLKSNTSFSPDVVQTLIRALNLIVFNNYFKFGDAIFLQTKGAPMGSPVSGLFAEFALRPLENDFLQRSLKKPLLWRRYVDDVFIVWEHGVQELRTFHESLNRVDAAYNFTLEIEKDNRLSFLDVSMLRKHGCIIRSVYRKPISAKVTIPADSYTTSSHKLSAYKGYIKRAKVVCSDSTLQKEFECIRKIAKQNGYSIGQVNKIIAKAEKPPSVSSAPVIEPKRVSVSYIRGFFESMRAVLKKWNVELVTRPSPKTVDVICRKVNTIAPDLKSGVYEIPFKEQDGSIRHYIGLTSRALKTRVSEHKGYIRTGRLCTALARENANNIIDIDFGAARIIQPFTTQFRTLMRESIEINKRGSRVCNDKASYEVPGLWLEMLKHLEKRV